MRRAAPWRSRRARARAAGAGRRPGRRRRAPPSAATPGSAPRPPPPASRSQPQLSPSHTHTQPLASWSCWGACDEIQVRHQRLLCVLAGRLAEGGVTRPGQPHRGLRRVRSLVHRAVRQAHTLHHQASISGRLLAATEWQPDCMNAASLQKISTLIFLTPM